MGIERYNYLRCNSDETPDSIKQEYKNILPTLINAVQNWWNSFSQSKEGWKVVANLKDGILIQSPRPFNHRPTYCPGYAENIIYLPGELCSELEVGWQDHSYGSLEDPKKDIAMNMMDILRSDEFLNHFFDYGQEDCLNAEEDNSKCNRKQ
jgi:hypothetical protein